jgi:hypothetical protein
VALMEKPVESSTDDDFLQMLLRLDVKPRVVKYK